MDKFTTVKSRLCQQKIFLLRRTKVFYLCFVKNTQKGLFIPTEKGNCCTLAAKLALALSQRCVCFFHVALNKPKSKRSLPLQADILPQDTADPDHDRPSER